MVMIGSCMNGILHEPAWPLLIPWDSLGPSYCHPQTVTKLTHKLTKLSLHGAEHLHHIIRQEFRTCFTLCRSLSTTSSWGSWMSDMLDDDDEGGDVGSARPWSGPPGPHAAAGVVVAPKQQAGAKGADMGPEAAVVGASALQLVPASQHQVGSFEVLRCIAAI